MLLLGIILVLIGASLLKLSHDLYEIEAKVDALEEMVFDLLKLERS